MAAAHSRPARAGNFPIKPGANSTELVLRIGKTDAADVQPMLDALRRAGLVIRRMQLIRPSLEDLFFEAVTDPTTGLRALPARPAAASHQDHMSQTLALLLDAYRDLNSRRMFWIVLILSGLVAASFAAIGLTPTGFEIFTWKFTSYFFNSKVVSPGDFLQKHLPELGSRTSGSARSPRALASDFHRQPLPRFYRRRAPSTSISPNQSAACGFS